MRRIVVHRQSAASQRPKQSLIGVWRTGLKSAGPADVSELGRPRMLAFQLEQQPLLHQPESLRQCRGPVGKLRDDCGEVQQQDQDEKAWP
jgi:hypothetical protein